MRQIDTDLEEDPETMRAQFYGFVLELMDSWKDRQQYEEGAIVGPPAEL